MIELFNEMEKHGLLKKCVKAGLISTKYEGWREVYMKYLAELSIGVSKSNAVFNTSVACKISERNIYRAIKFMEGN